MERQGHIGKTLHKIENDLCILDMLGDRIEMTNNSQNVLRAIARS